jgi:hypothetical protein
MQRSTKDNFAQQCWQKGAKTTLNPNIRDKNKQVPSQVAYSRQSAVLPATLVLQLL